MASAAQVFERFKTERPDLLIQDIGLVDVAARLGRSPQQVNKAVSRIYKKLDLEHYGQLTHLLAILEMFSRRVTNDWE